MKIGVDLDDVVFEFTKEFIKFYNPRYGKEIKFEDVKTYHFPDIFDISLKEVVDMIDEMVKQGIGRNLPFCDYAKESIVDLSKEHDIFFITSRTIRRGTLESLKRLFPELKFELIFSSNFSVGNEGKTKGEICNEKNIDFMIEDTKEHAKDIAGRGIKVLLLNKPWNEDYKEHPNIIKVNNWKEVVDNIK